MLTFIWHVFLVVWTTGCIAYGVNRYSMSETRKLSREVEKQVMQTRLAELQARERKALDV